MEWNPLTHKVIPESLTMLQREAVLIFLQCEKERHEEDIDCAKDFYWYPKPELNKVMRLFWDSAIERHTEDIEGIDELLKELGEKENGTKD